MDNNYKIFAKGFNKILDLIDNIKEVSRVFKFVVDAIPDEVIDKFSDCEDAPLEGEDYYAELSRMQNEIGIDFTTYKKYFHAEISVHRIFEDDMSPRELFSIYVRNVPKKPQPLMFYFEENNGKIAFKGTSDENYQKVIDIKYVVSFDYDENRQPYLVLRKFFRGEEFVKETHYPIDFDELAQAFEDEDPYEDDWTIEFEPDFDL